MVCLCTRGPPSQPVHDRRGWRWIARTTAETAGVDARVWRADRGRRVLWLWRCGRAAFQPQAAKRALCCAPRAP
eukprot:352766-Chlamydomonas_euryale.AAC.3